eukprot:3063996-Pleurochrysis_carterae.AAC.1
MVAVMAAMVVVLAEMATMVTMAVLCGHAEQRSQGSALQCAHGACECWHHLRSSRVWGACQ